MAPSASPPLLDVRGLSVRFAHEGALLEGVTQVDMQVEAGTVLCLVGESGCGKSITARALMGLLPESASASGSARLNGRELLGLPEGELRPLRGRHMGMIFQEPMTALNPVLRVGEQVMEPLRLHLRLSREAARARCVELFTQVGIPAPQSRLDDYPHQLSGGMRQRVMIAMALACGPELLLADEPTTALDVTIQGQILDLIARLSRERRMGVVFITHDLGVVAQMADTVAVMYAGQIVEQAPVRELFARPLHPYTQGLMAAAPTLQSRHLERLPVITGSVPPLGSLPGGCRFHPRCPKARPRCAAACPPLHPAAGEQRHSARCWLLSR